MSTTTLEIIDSQADIQYLVNLISRQYKQLRNLDLPNSPLYIDAQGAKLNRAGPISLLTILFSSTYYLVDILQLGATAFTTPSTHHTSGFIPPNFQAQTLKSIFEDADIPKVFFDSRNASAALFAQYAVSLQGVHDIQLMECAARYAGCARNYLVSLDKCFEQTQPRLVTLEQLFQHGRWRDAKEAAEKLIKPELGEPGKVFDERPIKTEIKMYCVGRVQYLPELRKILWEEKGEEKGEEWMGIVKLATERRVEETQEMGYLSLGRDEVWRGEESKMLDF